MKTYTPKDIHNLAPGFYWYAFPGCKFFVMTIRRDPSQTKLNFPYPDQTAVWLDTDPDTREDLKDLILIGPIEEPKI